MVSGIDKIVESAAKQYSEQKNQKKAAQAPAGGDIDKIVASAAKQYVDAKTGKMPEKENQNLKQTYVLVSAYQDAGKTVPIQMEVKTFWTGDAQLYMTVALTKIDSGVLEKSPATQKSGDTLPLFPESKYSIRSIFENVNTKDARFLKYVPDGFLNDAQKQAKQEALRKQEKEYASYGKTQKHEQELDNHVHQQGVGENGLTSIREQEPKSNSQETIEIEDAGENRFQELIEKAQNGDIIEFDEELEDIVAGKSYEELLPLLGKLPNRAARKWYIAQNNLIPSQIDRSLDLEGQARQAFELRNQNRTYTRNLMLDQEERKRLDISDPNVSFEEKIAEKISGKDMNRGQAIEDILRTATKTRKSVDEKLGLR